MIKKLRRKIEPKIINVLLYTPFDTMLKYFSSARFAFTISTYLLFLAYSIVKVAIKTEETNNYWIIISISAVGGVVLIMIAMLNRCDMKTIQRKNIQSIITILSSIICFLDCLFYP